MKQKLKSQAQNQTAKEMQIQRSAFSKNKVIIQQNRLLFASETFKQV